MNDVIIDFGEPEESFFPYIYDIIFIGIIAYLLL